MSVKGEPSSCVEAWLKYRPSVHRAASFMDTMAVPADPVKPVSQARRSSQGATYSEEWASPEGTMYASKPCDAINTLNPRIFMGASSGEKESQSFPGLKQQGHERSSGRDELSTARSFCFGCWSAIAAKAPGTSDMVVRLLRRQACFWSL
jgi:hypothetical protein